MNTLRNQSKSAVVVLFVGLGLFLSGSNTLGTLIEYGDFIGSTVVFENVREDSGTDPTPLYGTPIVSADTLDFDPVSFESFSQGAGAVDVTDGALGFGVRAKDGMHIPYIKFSESGDYTLAGFAGDAIATVSGLYVINIVEVDKVGINVIALSQQMQFTPNGGEFQLDDGGPMVIEQGIWKGEIFIDLTKALRDNGVADGFVTKVTVVADNTLITASLSDGNSALIEKKDFSGLSVAVPEPAMMSVLLMGAIVCSFARRIRRSA